MSKRSVTASSYLILQALASDYRYGFDIIDVTGLPSGTVYPALRRFEAQKLVRAKWESETRAHREGRPARRYYELSAAGVKALAEARDRFKGFEKFGVASDPTSFGSLP